MIKRTDIPTILLVLLSISIPGMGGQGTVAATANGGTPDEASILEIGPEWRFRFDPENVGVAKKWFTPQVSDADWGTLRGDRGWPGHGSSNYTVGYGWYRARVTVPEAFYHRKVLRLLFGAVDEEAEVYLNGQKAFEHTCRSTGLTPDQLWNKPFMFDPRKFLTMDKENLIAVRVHNSALLGGMHKPVALIAADRELSPSDSFRLLEEKRARSLLAVDREAAKTETRNFELPAGQRQLFLDDYGIARTDNLKRTMHSPKKMGAVIRPNPRIGLGLQIRSAPIWDPQKKVYRLWDAVPGGYHESKDGLHWYQPAVGQVEYQGSRDNNRVAVLLDGKPHRVDCAVYDPLEHNPRRRFKGLSFSSQATTTALQSDLYLYPCASDGVTWKTLDVAPLSTSDEYNLSFDEAEKRFIATVKVGGPYGRSVGLYTSKDFRQWTPYGLVFHADELDQVQGRSVIAQRFKDPTLGHPVFNDPNDYNVDIYNMAVFRYEGLYVGLPAVFYATGLDRDKRNKDGFHLIQLTCSRDLRHWQRLGDRRPFIGPSPRGTGAYDLTQLIGPSYPIYRANELWFYYTGLKYRDLPDHADPDEGAICLATLRRDGFISLDAGTNKGTVLTKPFTLPGRTLRVNLDAEHGEFQAEVLNPSGKVVAASVPMRGNLLQEQVRWQQGDPGAFKGQVMSLRFTLRGASFYAFWFEN